MNAVKLLCALLAGVVEVSAGSRYLRFEEVRAMVETFANSGLPGSGIRQPAVWSQWIRTRDLEIRRRADRGMEDSICVLILRGEGFTGLPPIENAHLAFTPEGKITAEAEQRLQAYAQTLLHPADTARAALTQDFLVRRGVDPAHDTDSFKRYLRANLRRWVFEEWAETMRARQAAETADPGAVIAARNVKHLGRGISPEAKFAANFAVDAGLAWLARAGRITPYSIRRAALVGPGMDFSSGPASRDFYPPQAVQPFALMESLTRLALSPPARLDLATLDLSPEVNSRLYQIPTSNSYVVTLVRNSFAASPKEDWSEEFLSYWNHFGEYLGKAANADVPPGLEKTLLVRGVAVQPLWLKLIHPLDLDIVAQTIDAPISGFDLIVATNLFDYYNPFEQALALSSIANMLKPGGIFLSTDVLPPQHPPNLEYLGRHSVFYQQTSLSGDDVVYYRRR
jgi:hypothetical protein